MCCAIQKMLKKNSSAVTADYEFFIIVIKANPKSCLTNKRKTMRCKKVEASSDVCFPYQSHLFHDFCSFAKSLDEQWCGKSEVCERSWSQRPMNKPQRALKKTEAVGWKMTINYPFTEIKAHPAAIFFYNFRFPRIKWTKWNKKLLALVMEFCFCSKFRCVSNVHLAERWAIFDMEPREKGVEGGSVFENHHKMGNFMDCVILTSFRIWNWIFSIQHESSSSHV